MTRARAIATAVALWVAAVALCGPALAVQTDRFGLMASGARSHIFYPPGDSTVEDTVVVYNRTNGPIDVRLGVNGMTAVPAGTPSPGASPDVNYEPSGPDGGLAPAIHLRTTEVHLGPHGQEDVRFTIDRGAAHAGDYAAITAVEETPPDQPGVAVHEQLAVLVGIQSEPHAGSDEGLLTGGSLRLLLTVVAGVLVAVVAAGLLLRRRATARR